MAKYNVRLKIFPLQGLSESELYRNLVYKCTKMMVKNEFPYHFKKIIACYKKVGYNIDTLKQTVCLVFNPIKVGRFA